MSLLLSPSAPRRRALAAVACAGLLLTGVATSAPPAVAAVPSPAGWTTVFSDDFAGPAGTGLDTSRWIYDIGRGYPGGAPNWGTGEVETMTSSTRNVFQDGAGHLVIRALRDAAGNWTSGRVETRRTDFQPPAGGVLRVEAAVQTPNLSGAAAQGYWPAFWMLGEAARGTGAAGWPGIGEIDVLEDVNGSGSVFGTLHCGTNPGGPCNETTGLGSGAHPVSGAKTGFHTYGVEWDRSVSPQQLRWYVDGRQYFTVRSDQVDATTWRNATGHGFFLILNLAIGGGWPGAPTAATVSGGQLVVDHVAVYSRGGTSTPTPPPPTGSTPTGTVQAESHAAQSGTQVETTSDTGGGSDVGWIGNGDWLRYDGVDFGSGRSRVDLRVASGAPAGVSGLVQVRLDSPTGPVAASVAVGNTGGWQSWRTLPGQLSASGRHTVYLTFSSGQPADFVNLNWFALA